MSGSESLPPTSDLPDRGLPPVEPPNARFILQLFVVPAAIVTIIALVVLLFNWLAQMGADPTKYVATLRTNSKARWQAAASLADVLNDQRNADLKRDRRLAADLASLLTDELKQPSGAEEQAMLEIYLCRALGEFAVPDAAPPLIEAAGRTRAEEIGVRRAALEGLAVLAANVPAAENPHVVPMDQALIKAADDADEQIRLAAVFALGVVGDEAAVAQLKKSLIDVYPDVRYNAATGLARHGDAAALPVVLEMLDPDEQASVRLETEEQSRAFKRNLITVNALQVAPNLFPKLGEDDRAKLRAAITRLEDKDQPAEIRLRATEVRRQLEQGVAEAPAA